MKIFGWGRKKEPPPVQPTHREEAKKSGVPARSTHSPGTARWRSPDPVEQETHGWPSKGVNFGQEALPRETAPGPELAWSEERLQETIRFVFSHEQDGLLAIGTFALDQLAGACSNYPANQPRKPPAIAAAIDRNIQIMLQELRSSDDDEFFDRESHGLYSLIPTSARKKKDLPVFGDHKAFSDLHSTNPIVRPVVIKPKDPPSTDSDSPEDDATGIAGKRDDLKLLISDFTCPKPVSGITDLEDEQSDDEFHSPSFVCGLFGSRSSRRSGTQKPHLGEKEKRKKLPPEKLARVGENEYNLKRATGRKGFSPKLGRLWRSGCNGPPSAGAEVAPEPEPERESSRLQISGPPCIANVEREGGTSGARTSTSKFPSQPKAGEGKRRSFGKGTWACAQNGKWIRTDSEFVVLEM